MGAFCELYVDDGWTMIAVTFALLFTGSVAVWWCARPKMTLPTFLYHVFNYGARFNIFASPETRARFKEPAVSAAAGMGIALLVANFLALGACPGSIM